MEALSQLLTVDSVAHTILVLSLVAVLGLAIGGIKVFGINLGIAGVLFAGLIFGHYKITINPQVIEFIREFGLILFVYTVGMQVGPGFFSSLKRQGLQLNLMAAAIVILGMVITIALTQFGHINMAAGVGLFSGATTNTPSLAAAQQALKEVNGVTGEMLKLPGIGYAVSYPFGIIGTILVMVFIRFIFRISLQKEEELYAKSHENIVSKLKTINLEVKNNNLNGLPIKKIPGLQESGIVISRLFHDGRLNIAQPDMILSLGDILLAVGPGEKLDELRVIVGSESTVDLRAVQSKIISRRVVITKKNALGKSIQELDLMTRYGITITRVSRAEIEMAASPEFRLQFGDTVLAVGEEDVIKKAAVELGGSARQLDHPHVISIFVGIVLGVILGNMPIYLPGMSSPIKLGLAGGPLIVAVLLSRVGRVGPLIWYMPISANFMVREIGIVLFLSCVGLKAGDQFMQTLTQGDGFYWMAAATLITFVPLLCVAVFARLKFKLNYMSLCGLLSGAMTDPPALAFANSITSSSASSISYATVYPLVMLMRIICAQILVLFFAH